MSVALTTSQQEGGVRKLVMTSRPRRILSAESISGQEGRVDREMTAAEWDVVVERALVGIDDSKDAAALRQELIAARDRVRAHNATLDPNEEKHVLCVHDARPADTRSPCLLFRPFGRYTDVHSCKVLTIRDMFMNRDITLGLEFEHGCK